MSRDAALRHQHDALAIGIGALTWRIRFKPTYASLRSSPHTSYGSMLSYALTRPSATWCSIPERRPLGGASLRQMIFVLAR